MNNQARSLVFVIAFHVRLLLLDWTCRLLDWLVTPTSKLGLIGAMLVIQQTRELAGLARSQSMSQSQLQESKNASVVLSISEKESPIILGMLAEAENPTLAATELASTMQVEFTNRLR